MLSAQKEDGGMTSPVVVTVVGARPQFVKAAVVSRALAKTSIREVLVHTGQHYDPMMSDVFFKELDIPPPARSLGTGSGSHGKQTGEMLAKIEEVLLEVKPAAMLVYGDTNSTLAGALAASKLHIPVAHVEAGLRSFNRKMPEEVNRVLTDHVSDLLFCPTRLAIENLRAEGITRGVVHVGDVMHDLALQIAPIAERSSLLRDDSFLKEPYLLATIHRAENTDDPDRLRGIFAALAEVSVQTRVLLPIHPRTRQAIERAGVASAANVRIVEPLGFIDMAYALRHASAIVTDSGGVQKEAYFHRRPCVTVRTETEWVETVSAGWNRLASPDDSRAIRVAIEDALRSPRPTTTIDEYGAGRSADAIAEALLALAS